MATSNISTLTVTTKTILETALRKIGVGLEGEVIQAADMEQAKLALNLFLGDLMTSAVKMHLITEATVFLTKGKQYYTLGPNGDHASLEANHSTTTTQAEVLGTTTVILTSLLDSVNGRSIAVGDAIGIEQTDTTMHWSLVTLIAGSTITFAAGTTAAVASGAVVFSYEAKMPKPMKILNANYLYTTGSEIPISVHARQEIFHQANKETGSQAVYVAFDPKVDDGKLWVWATSGSVIERIKLLVRIPIEIFNTADNTPHFPREWFNTLIWCTARELLTEYGTDEKTADRVERMAERKLMDMEDFDVEYAPTQFQPEEGY